MSSSVHSHSKSSLFLIELIISLCFFSLASVVCVRLFVYAHKVSTESRRETLAIQMSQNAAECFIAADGDEEEFRRLFAMTLPQDPADIITEFTITSEPGGPPEAGNQAAGSPPAAADGGSAAADGIMCRLLIRNTAADGTDIFSLEVLHYRQKGSAGKTRKGSTGKTNGKEGGK